MIVGRMPGFHQRFLVYFERGDLDGALIGVPSGTAESPAVECG
jgi:hypothetical protein